MAPDRFRVLFNGEVSPGRNVDDVKKKMAAAFKVDPAVVDGMFSGGQLARGNLTAEQAEAYSRALTQAGAVCRVVPDDGPAPARYVIRKKPASSTMVCPKCGHEQPTADECLRCGVIVGKIAAADRQVPNRPVSGDRATPTQAGVDMQDSIRSDTNRILAGCSLLVILTGIAMLLFGAFGFRSLGYVSPRFMLAGSVSVIGGVLWLVKILGERGR